MKLFNWSAFWALLLTLALHSTPGHSVQPANPQQPQHETHAIPSAQRNTAGRFNRNLQSAAQTSHVCEYKEIMMELRDRVRLLATIDEDQRNRLQNIDQRIADLETNNMGRLDSIEVTQKDFLKRLDSMEHLERLTKRELEEWRADFDELLKQQSKKEISTDLNNVQIAGMILARDIRETSSGTTGNITQSSTDVDTKLEALATLLTASARSIHALESQLQKYQKSLQQTTKRFNNMQRRQQATFGPTYLPPPQQTTSCAQGAPTVEGVLKLQLAATAEPFYVFCDEMAFGGGWTVIQNRYTGDVNFQRGWLEYKTGFGNLAGEFFIGLDKLHALTNSAVHELLIALEDFEGEQRHARYKIFAVGNEAESYALNVLGEYEGTAGDALTYHAGSKFSTFDNDNDGSVEHNCAQAHTGAWWYNWCEQSNLNGKYFGVNESSTAPTYQGMYWHHFHGPNYSLKSSRMMIRPVAADLENRR